MILNLFRQHRRLAVVISVVLVLVVVGLVGGVFFLSRSFAAPPQPLPFQHSTHVAAGVTCLYCHPSATIGEVAGLPSTAKCMGCHASVQPQNPEAQQDIDQLIAYWNEKKPIEWVKVNDQPDFVRFWHRPHLAAGVACESCHGDVSQMGYAESYNLNMGFCLSCHNQQPPEKVTLLIDCATCHY
jgi:hypothetical protein